MENYEVWLEGFSATGQSRTAVFCGEYSAESFKDAVKQYVDTIIPEDKKFIDMKELSFWGCRFFSSEAKARKSFG